VAIKSYPCRAVQESTPDNRGLPAHPCMNHAAHETVARLHLPVAPKCNIRCLYCERRVSPHLHQACPGVAAAVLTPQQAAETAAVFRRRWGPEAIIGIAGPGEPLANPETLETLTFIRAQLPDARFCLCTNGLALPDVVARLHLLGVEHLSITINAPTPAIAALIHPWVRQEGRIVRGGRAARLLVERQMTGLAAAVACGMHVKVNTVVIPEVNDAHVVEVARRVADCGACVINLIPLIPRGRMAGHHPPTGCQLKLLRAECARYLPVFERCRQCRADAQGIPGRMVAE
jgi:nitrogen fixation protein NifB